MKRFLKTTISIILGLAILLSFGCASLPEKLSQEFAFVDMVFVGEDPNDPGGHIVVDPVFDKNDPAAVIYFFFVNAMVFNGEISITGTAAVLDADGNIILERVSLEYNGVERGGWYQVIYPAFFGPGKYIFKLILVDNFGKGIIVETLDFEITDRVFI